MLKAGVPGLDVPDGFEALPEEEQRRRLDAVIGVALGKDEKKEKGSP